MEHVEKWRVRAALCELLAMGFRRPSDELAEALADGDFADACLELCETAGIGGEAVRSALDRMPCGLPEDPGGILSVLRAEHARLFVGMPEPRVSPYAGIWWAGAKGVEPMMFVNSRSMEVERFMRRCGMGQVSGRNQPLDEVPTMLEFMMYVSLVCAGDVPAREGSAIGCDTLGDFKEAFLADWIFGFCAEVRREDRLSFYAAQATILEKFVASI